MKINTFGVQAINTYANQARTVKETRHSATFADKLEISSAAKEMQSTSTYAADRAERVQQLKADIQSGDYKVDANQVARDMLNYYRG